MNCCLCDSKESVFEYLDFEGNPYVKCNQCGLVYQNPRKITQYEDSYWTSAVDPDGKGRDLTAEREDKIRNRHQGEIDFIHKLPKGRILGVGCGLGFFLSAIEGWDKYGVEPSGFARDYIGKHFPDIRATPSIDEYEDNVFDVVHCFHAIEHIASPHEILKEIHRTIKPGRILIVSTPNIESFCARRFKGNYRLLGTAHIVLWSKKTLSRLLRENGFEPFKTRYPFFGTRYFAWKNLLRLFDTSKVSPPFYGNEMTIYARKDEKKDT